jgi:hypothetical protein
MAKVQFLPWYSSNIPGVLPTDYFVSPTPIFRRDNTIDGEITDSYSARYGNQTSGKNVKTVCQLPTIVLVCTVICHSPDGLCVGGGVTPHICAAQVRTTPLAHAPGRTPAHAIGPLHHERWLWWCHVRGGSPRPGRGPPPRPHHVGEDHLERGKTTSSTPPTAPGTADVHARGRDRRPRGANACHAKAP